MRTPNSPARSEAGTSIFLDAFQGTNTRVPVWFMRQAGRYLPAYQALRARYTLEEMFDTPELAAEVTCQPIQPLGVDAAILFADILTLPGMMGFDITFHKDTGPVIHNPVSRTTDLKAVPDADNFTRIGKTIRLIKERLPANVPLIGFAGSPFTVATYLIEGGSAHSFKKTLHFMFTQPADFGELMTRLTANTVRYLNAQKEAGVDAFQLFDTWGGTLPKDIYERSVLPHIQEIFRSVSLPSIYYLKNSHHLLGEMAASGADVLSVCESVDFSSPGILAEGKVGVQGNFFNGLLFADRDTIQMEVARVLERSRKFPKYIFNLSHGVFPNTDPDVLKAIVDQVHAFDRRAGA